jgi:hypothetical protein
VYSCLRFEVGLTENSKGGTMNILGNLPDILGGILGAVTGLVGSLLKGILGG